MSARYAVYLAPPPDSELWRLGSRVLGRDAATGDQIEGFAPSGFTPQAWRDLTAEPRRYGFHATLKAPFRLAAGRRLQDLEAALAALAAATPAFDLGPLQIGALSLGGGGFVALTPAAPPPALGRLEARAVCDLDPFRAPLSEDEIQRRRPDRLSERQRENLARWGYPHVLDAFRLHFTLTGATAEAEAIAAKLSPIFPVFRFRVDALVLFSQEEGADFMVSRRFPLKA